MTDDKGKAIQDCYQTNDRHILIPATDWQSLKDKRSRQRTLTIVLPHLPPAELNPNKLRRSHWSVRSRETKDAADEIGWLAKTQWHDGKPMMKARISYEFHLKDHRRRDLDNLLSACKAYQDGLIEVGVLFYDDAAHLEIGSIKAVEDDHEETIIKVEEL